MSFTDTSLDDSINHNPDPDLGVSTVAWDTYTAYEDSWEVILVFGRRNKTLSDICPSSFESLKACFVTELASFFSVDLVAAWQLYDVVATFSGESSVIECDEDLNNFLKTARETNKFQIQFELILKKHIRNCMKKEDGAVVHDLIELLISEVSHEVILEETLVRLTRKIVSCLEDRQILYSEPALAMQILNCLENPRESRDLLYSRRNKILDCCLELLDSRRSERISLLSLTLLTSLLTHETDASSRYEFSKTCVANKICDSLLGTMITFPLSSDCQTLCLKLLQQLVHHREASDAMIRHDVISIISETVTTHSFRHEVIDASFSLLACLSAQDEFQIVFLDSGGCQLLLHALQTMSHLQNSVEQMFRVASRISEDHEIARHMVRMSIEDALTSCLLTHVESYDSESISHAFIALKNLYHAKEHPMHHGLVEICLLALRQHGEEVEELAVELLGVLAESLTIDEPSELVDELARHLREVQNTTTEKKICQTLAKVLRLDPDPSDLHTLVPSVRRVLSTSGQKKAGSACAVVQLIAELARDPEAHDMLCSTSEVAKNVIRVSKIFWSSVDVQIGSFASLANMCLSKQGLTLVRRGKTLNSACHVLANFDEERLHETISFLILNMSIHEKSQHKIREGKNLSLILSSLDHFSTNPQIVQNLMGALANSSCVSRDLPLESLTSCIEALWYFPLNDAVRENALMLLVKICARETDLFRAEKQQIDSLCRYLLISLEMKEDENQLALELVDFLQNLDVLTIRPDIESEEEEESASSTDTDFYQSIKSLFVSNEQTEKVSMSSLSSLTVSPREVDLKRIYDADDSPDFSSWGSPSRVSIEKTDSFIHLVNEIMV